MSVVFLLDSGAVAPCLCREWGVQSSHVFSIMSHLFLCRYHHAGQEGHHCWCTGTFSLRPRRRLQQLRRDESCILGNYPCLRWCLGQAASAFLRGWIDVSFYDTIVYYCFNFYPSFLVYEILLECRNVFRKEVVLMALSFSEHWWVGVIALLVRDLRRTTSSQPCQRCGA